MRWCVAYLTLLVPGVLRAQTPAVAPAPPGPDPRAFTGTPPPPVAPVATPSPVATVSPAPRQKSGAPEARRGFQMHIVPFTAMAFPFGRATDARRDWLNGRYSWQWVPLSLGLGAKLIDELYLGAYLDLGVGYEGSDSKTKSRCEAGDDLSDDVDCSSLSVHAGVEARYNIAPSDSLNGWLGYGFGLTTGSQSISDAGRYSETTTAHGIDFARLSGGLDFRLSRGFGMGPFAVFSLGRYLNQRTVIRDDVTFSGSIDNPAFHSWVTIGLRLVMFP